MRFLHPLNMVNPGRNELGFNKLFPYPLRYKYSFGKSRHSQPPLKRIIFCRIILVRLIDTWFGGGFVLVVGK